MARQEMSAVVNDGGSMMLFGTDNPDQIIARATKVAKVLSQVVESRKMFTMIGPSKHLRVEAWQTLGAMTGVYPIVAWTRKLENGWEARVEAKRNGEVVGAAECECLNNERNWANKEDHSLRSMAQTRATSKALSSALRFIVTLAGYEGTPAEEMPSDPRPSDAFRRPQERTAASPASQVSQETPRQETAAGTKPVGSESHQTWTGLIDKVTFREYKKKGQDGKPNGETGKTYSIITKDNGPVFKTWSDTFAKDCKFASENDEPMTITYTSTEFRGNLEFKAETCTPAAEATVDGPESEA